jgi:hypothetical protein
VFTFTLGNLFVYLSNFRYSFLSQSINKTLYSENNFKTTATLYPRLPLHNIERMSLPIRVPAPNTAFPANFARLDQQLRCQVFRLLYDDLDAATEFVSVYPSFVHEVGMLLFRSYSATGPQDLYYLLAALTEVPEFSSYVETITLDPFLDGPGQSGFWEWLLVFATITLAPGHLGLPVQHIGQQLIRRIEDDGIPVINGVLHDTEDWPLHWHYMPLLGAILPALCPHVVEVAIPYTWGSAAAQTVWTSFANVTVVRRI